MALSGFKPTLLSVWGSDVFDFPRESAIKRRLLVWNLGRATAVASTSRVMATQVQALTPERHGIAVTPFGVNLDRFAPAPGREAARPLTLGIVKTLAHKYGVDLLLQAFAALLSDQEVTARQPDLRLRIVGDGPQRADLQALAQQLQILPRVDFTGAVPHEEVPAALHSFDIYAAPSRMDSESFGVAVVEASACALPVVVSDVGGLPEVVLNGLTGLVVPREDVPALHQALRSWCWTPGCVDAWGGRGAPMSNANSSGATAWTSWSAPMPTRWWGGHERCHGLEAHQVRSPCRAPARHARRARTGRRLATDQ